ncbi:addiction module antidote protein [Pinirhizobacter sp.]|jgi:DNA-binding phage protein|uniref:helix-turn-helix domain-containing transcriptional regulator n=1 Tax=Pinirhizobacter sp. TaxID=2950432 RepID=UPI002F42E1FB
MTGNEGKMMRSKSHDVAMAELYKKKPDLAIQVINSIFEDGDQGELLVVLRQLTLAFGGAQAVATQAELNPTQIYRTLSREGNPALSSLSAILKAMGLRLAIQPLEKSATPA